MNTTQIILIAIVVLLVVGAVAFYMRRQRSDQLKSRFGPEYARAVDDEGGAAKAEHALSQRQKRVEGYELRPLTPENQQKFSQEWNRIQLLFVDSPSDATTQADDLLGQVMTAKGYPEGPFDQRLEDLSVKHAEAVQGYRSAHEVQQRRAQGKASTEDERRAMISYRRLFNELVGQPEPQIHENPANANLRAAS